MYRVFDSNGNFVDQFEDNQLHQAILLSDGIKGYITNRYGVILWQDGEEEEFVQNEW